VILEWELTVGGGCSAAVCRRQSKATIGIFAMAKRILPEEDTDSKHRDADVLLPEDQLVVLLVVVLDGERLPSKL
jgi:hypothetical protein